MSDDTEIKEQVAKVIKEYEEVIDNIFRPMLDKLRDIIAKVEAEE